MFVPINLGAIIEWKGETQSAHPLHQVPINLGAIIEWKAFGRIHFWMLCVPINLGAIIEWKAFRCKACSNLFVPGVPINLGAIIEWKAETQSAHPLHQSCGSY